MALQMGGGCQFQVANRAAERSLFGVNKLMSFQAILRIEFFGTNLTFEIHHGPLLFDVNSEVSRFLRMGHVVAPQVIFLSKRLSAFRASVRSGSRVSHQMTV